MPPKPNGFYMFMLAKQRDMKSKTTRAPGMREMPSFCKDQWKALSPAEKAHFDNLAKQERARQQNFSDPTLGKLDCHRQVIADRVDPVKEENKRRTLERKLLLNSWQGQDVKEVAFHILDFQVMYDDIMEDQHFPLEIGMVCFTLNDGIQNFMHRFINPGGVPQGNRHLAVSHADNSHKIPLNFEHSDGNLKALTSHMKDFVTNNSDGHEIPPIFCLQSHRRLVENCLQFIYSKVYVPDTDRFSKVYCLEDLVHGLISMAGQKQAPESQVVDMLRQNRWDYNSSIRCFYHEELDCAFCSLSIVRRYSFAIFDTLSTLHDFKLTDKHMPDEMDKVFITGSTDFGRAAARGGSADARNNRCRKTSTSSTYSDTHSSRSDYPPQRDNAWHGPRETTWQPPRVAPVKVALNDEESEEEEEEEEENPKPTEYSLGRLRLPKSVAQVQSQVGNMGIQDHGMPNANQAVAATTPTRGAWRGAPNGIGGAPIRPLGRGAAPPRMAHQGQVRPLGRGAAAASAMPPPPPGFERPPMMGVAAPSQQHQQQLQASGGMMSDKDFPALGGGRGRGVARGRGTLPSSQ